ncbi:VOC family protein [Nocardia sp. NPDC050712]|uniref:VOC family protein n=1 Tax=Nocardia sp. NPDC050712 TaxID=3155518 RepID=UPI0034069259
MHIERVTPKLVVEGAKAALEYYREVFGAEVGELHEADGRVTFAELELPGGVLFQVKDADSVDSVATVLLSVVVDEPDRLAERMAAGGGEIVFEVADQPYGIRQGRVRDPFGHEWILGTPLHRG